MKKIFEELNERGKNYSSNQFEYEDECIEERFGRSRYVNTSLQKSQLIDLKQNLDKYVKILTVFGFNSGRYDLNLIKHYLIPLI